ncbi:MAG TPA: hypothetical protein VKW04_21845 [Planctomycetota bacterium]|nr:hypothetical protein [Planctomycetota bacterium]
MLGPLQALSARFHRTLDHRAVDPGRPAYRNALFHRLVAQTSCSRYLGEGRFTEYARELCRRGQAILDHDFP